MPNTVTLNIQSEDPAKVFPLFKITPEREILILAHTDKDLKRLQRRNPAMHYLVEIIMREARKEPPPENPVSGARLAVLESIATYLKSSVPFDEFLRYCLADLEKHPS